jgi:predicted Zn-dependent protease
MHGLCSDARMKCFKGFSWVVLVLFLGCTTVSETGRRQLILLSPSEEMQLGISSFNEMKKELPISKDASAKAMVERVGRRIAAVASLTNAQWEFVVFESKEPNAFCLPGGKVGVYTGILPITKDEAGLATVIGHEVAHASARHGAERLSNQMLLQTGGQVLGTTVALGDPRWQGVATSVYGLGANLGYALPHSRNQESEADRIGLIYMARAGYNPEAAIAFWERFAEVNRQSGSGTPWFLRTHPLSETRIQRIREWIPEAKREYRPR